MPYLLELAVRLIFQRFEQINEVKSHIIINVKSIEIAKKLDYSLIEIYF